MAPENPANLTKKFPCKTNWGTGKFCKAGGILELLVGSDFTYK